MTYLRRAAAGGTLAILAACAGSDEVARFEGQSAAQIFRAGERELAVGEAADAAETFAEVERLYPYSEFAKRALIMQAFAFHSGRDYEQARAAAQRYLDFYPADEDAAYAQYLLALSYYDQIDQIGRDQGLTFQALQALRAVIERHPETEWARSAGPKFDLAFDHLAGKEMEIGRYYHKRRHWSAAINRFRVVVEDFQTTTHTPEALMRLTEAYLALGFEDEARTAAAILGYNYQGSPFYEDAYRQLTRRGLEPGAQGDNWLAAIYRQAIRGEFL